MQLSSLGQKVTVFNPILKILARNVATTVTFTYCFTALRLLFIKPHPDSASVFGQRGNTTELSKLLNATQQIIGRTRLWSFGARLAERCLLVDESQRCSCRNNSFSRAARVKSPGKTPASQFSLERWEARGSSEAEPVINRSAVTCSCPLAGREFLIDSRASQH